MLLSLAEWDSLRLRDYPEHDNGRRVSSVSSNSQRFTSAPADISFAGAFLASVNSSSASRCVRSLELSSHKTSVLIQRRGAIFLSQQTVTIASHNVSKTLNFYDFYFLTNLLLRPPLIFLQNWNLVLSHGVWSNIWKDDSRVALLILFENRHLILLTDIKTNSITDAERIS